MDDKLELLLSGQQYKKYQEAYLGIILEKYDLSIVDVRVLMTLYEHEAFDTAKDIVETHYLTKSYVSKSVDHLIAKGYLERKHLKDDRRYVHLIIQEDAKEVIQEIQKKRVIMLQKLFYGIKQEEIEMLQALAQKISNNISNILEEQES